MKAHVIPCYTGYTGLHRDVVCVTPHSALPAIQERRLDKWTHNKTIQKALESYRVSDEVKAYLRTLKVK